MTRILGIDPGSRITGYGLIDVEGTRSQYVDSGCIRLQQGMLPERLKVIFESLSKLIVTYRPQVMAIERVFMHRNPDSALILGQARGAAICAGVVGNMSISEYAARVIKQAVVGNGGADKQQVQHMVGALLQLQINLQADAADALAVALCHGHTLQTLDRVGTIPGRLRQSRRR